MSAPTRELRPSPSRERSSSPTATSAASAGGAASSGPEASPSMGFAPRVDDGGGLRPRADLQRAALGAGQAIQRQTAGGAAPAAAAGPTPPTDFTALAKEMADAFATIQKLPAGDPGIPAQLARILGPLGVTVATTPAAGADAPTQWLDAVRQAIGKVAAQLPATLVDAPKPTTLEGTLKAMQAFTTWRNKHQNQAHADEAHQPTLLVLNKLYGVEQVGISWQADAKKAGSGAGGRVASSEGLAAAAAGMAYVGTTDHATPSGQTAKAKDAQGQDVDIKTRVGADTLYEVWQGGAAPSFIAAQGGEAGIKEHGHKIASWCGIFVTHVLNKVGAGGGQWVAGGGVGFLKWPARTQASKVRGLAADPVAGDVAYAMGHDSHYAIVVRTEGDTLFTVDGNSGPGGATAGGKIVAQARPKSFFSNIYERP